MLLLSQHKKMQRHNNRVLQPAPACAACKHQRKKCNETCPLAPYFPAHRNREFQAVHKVFGVSNVTKMMKSVREGERRKVVESLVWEAICRQNDAVSGPYAEYKKVLEELKACKLAQTQSQNPTGFVGQVGLDYKPIIPCLGGWNNGGNSINNGNEIMDIINGGVLNGSNLFNYFHDHHNLSVIIDSSPYTNSSTYNLMKLQQDKEINSSVDVPIQQQQQQHPTNFHQCF